MQDLLTLYFNILLFNCSYFLIALNKPSCVLVYFYCLKKNYVYKYIMMFLLYCMHGYRQ